MKHSVPHDLGQDKAKKVAVAALDSYKARFAEYNPQTNWVSDTHAEIKFTVKGMKLDGSLQINANDFELDLNVPFMLKPFKGKAIGVIEAEINEWIAKAKKGEI